MVIYELMGSDAFMSLDRHCQNGIHFNIVTIKK